MSLISRLQHRSTSGFMCALATMVLSGTIACTPRLKPLQGIQPENAVLPSFELPAGHRDAKFKWEINDNVMSIMIRGDGRARIASPDSARVDLSISGPFGGGASVVLVGDSTRVPPDALMTELIPPAPLLWAAFGRLNIPALSDTVIRVQGDTLRADIGKPVQWRIISVKGDLRRVERIDKGRIVEFVERRSDKSARYEAIGRRKLVITSVEEKDVTGFDQKIWSY